MKFIVGYQALEDDSFLNGVVAAKERVLEVYFPWGDIPNGRGVFAKPGARQPFELQARLVSDLRRIASAGIKLNLLLNGNCHGRFSQARSFFEKIGSSIDFIKGELGLQTVTTASPLVAKFVKSNFPEIETRASVNMRIGSAQAMDCLGDLFDGFYLKRELNRDLKAVAELRRRCDEHGKKLYPLVNSGCLNECPVQTFHDNLVAHEEEISGMDNAYEFKGLCQSYLRAPAKRLAVLRSSNFIRPEDLALYEPYFDAVKLATRVNRNPLAVLNAYLQGCYSGNLLDLLEPNHAEAFYPEILENSRIPSDFGAKTVFCARDCERCGYCEKVFEHAKVNLEKTGEAFSC